MRPSNSSATATAENTVLAGIHNLLINCAALQPGERVLIVGEENDHSWFDPALCQVTAAQATKLGGIVKIIMTRPGENTNTFQTDIANLIQDVDLTIFFSRLGDQVRFLDTPGQSRKVMCYTLTMEHLNSQFAILNHHTMSAMRDKLMACFTGNSSYTLTCKNGTNLKAVIPNRSEHQLNSRSQPFSMFTLELFPVMIFPPINFSQLNGSLVLNHFLTSTSTREYTDSVLRLPSPVIAEIVDCRMTGFQGDEKVIAAIKTQLERAAAITGGDPYRINSWHTGINNHTFFKGDPYENLERWGTVAYGSPRYTHFHAAGHDPGDVSINLFDISIQVEDQLLWKDGKFVFLDHPHIQSLFTEAGQAPDSSSQQKIGILET